MNILFLELSQAGVPFPSGTPSTAATSLPSVSPSEIPAGVGENIANGIGWGFGQGYAQVQNAAANIDPSMKAMWDGLFGPGSAYLALMKGFTPILVLGFMLWSIYLMQDFLEKGFLSHESKYRLGWLLLTFLLFANQGALLGQGVRAMNEVVLSVNQSVLDVTINGISNRDAIRSVQINSEVYSTASRLSETCKKISDEEKYKSCKEDKYKQAIEIVKQRHRDWGFQAMKAIGAIGNAGTVVVTSPATAPIIGFLIGFSVAFYIFIKISMLIWASSAPIWLATTLFPLRTRGITIFMTGFWGLGMVVVSYTLVQGFIGIILASFASSSPMLMAILIGIMAPFLAIAIGSGSAFGIFAGLSGLTVNLGRSFGVSSMAR